MSVASAGPAGEVATVGAEGVDEDAEEPPVYDQSGNEIGYDQVPLAHQKRTGPEGVGGGRVKK